MANVTSTVQSCMALAKPDLRKTPSPVVIWAGSAHPPTPNLENLAHTLGIHYILLTW